MAVCGGWSAYSNQQGATKIITLWCRSWTCTDCAPFRVGALKRMAMDGKPSTFITLTVNPAVGESREHRAQALSDAWKIIVKRARRKFQKMPLEYLAVFEETKRGEPHLHILCRAPYIPHGWLSNQMLELMHAPIVDIRRVGNTKNAARYVAKYVGKGPKAFPRLKRYWHSKQWLSDDQRAERLARRSTGNWHVERQPAWYVAEQFAQQSGGYVHSEKEGEFYVFAHPPWESG